MTRETPVRLISVFGPTEVNTKVFAEHLQTSYVRYGAQLFSTSDLRLSPTFESSEAAIEGEREKADEQLVRRFASSYAAIGSMVIGGSKLIVIHEDPLDTLLMKALEDGITDAEDLTAIKESYTRIANVTLGDESPDRRWVHVSARKDNLLRRMSGQVIDRSVSSPRSASIETPPWVQVEPGQTKPPLPPNYLDPFRIPDQYHDFLKGQGESVTRFYIDEPFNINDIWQ